MASFLLAPPCCWPWTIPVSRKCSKNQVTKGQLSSKLSTHRSYRPVYGASDPGRTNRLTCQGPFSGSRARESFFCCGSFAQGVSEKTKVQNTSQYSSLKMRSCTALRVPHSLVECKRIQRSRCSFSVELGCAGDFSDTL